MPPCPPSHDARHPLSSGHCCRSSSSACRQKQIRLGTKTAAAALLAVFAASLPSTMAQQSCVSLQGSTACPAFASASVNTNLTGNFPFLKFVSNTQSFDQGLRNYIQTSYAQQQYEDILGCSRVNLTNTTNLYARFTTTVLCNAIVQSSKQSCGLSDQAATPLCADACADFAISEQVIISSPDLCGTPGNNAIPQIRADFTRCSNPGAALSNNCIAAVKNEPTECGFQNNLEGLCSFCSKSTTNSTDTCCINANVESRCQGVHLPTTVSMPPVFPSSTSSARPSSTAGGASGGQKSNGLSGGAIAGIVIGSLIGAALVIAAVIFCCMQMRRRKYSQAGSVFNTPSPSRHHSSKGNVAPPMAFGGDGNQPPTIVPGARVQRMSALEESASLADNSDRGAHLTAYGGSQIGPYDSPESIRGALAAGLPKRQGSLSSHSALGTSSSPFSGSGQSRSLSSPDGLNSAQSEQLQFFKDYYSQDDIHPNDTVATLWAYQPRAGDEFELERGDMLKVVGIWDDGWATGVRLSETAEQWEARKAEQRDSGVSNGSGRLPIESDSEIKAFPLVCVCLPQHWRKTIEGDSAALGGRRSRGDRAPPSP